MEKKTSKSTSDGAEAPTVADPHALLMLITVVTSGGSEYECARLAATGMPSLMRCRLCGMALQKADGETWHLVPDQEGEALYHSDTVDVAAELRPLHEAAMARGSSLLIQEAGDPDGPLIPLFLEKRGARSLAVVPVATLRNQFGMLIAARPDGESLRPEDVSILETLAQHLAIAIENCRLSDSLRKYNEDLQDLVDDRTSQLGRSEERQRVLLEINNAVIANLSRQSLFNAVAESLAKVVPFQRASLVLNEPEADVLRVYGLAGGATKQFAPVGSVLPANAGYVETVIEKKRPHVRGDLLVGDRTEIEDSLLEEGHRSYVLVPLIAKTRVLGTLNLASEEVDRYSAEDAQFLLEVGKQVALAIENMLAYEKIDELQRQMASENQYLREEISEARDFGEIIGSSSALLNVVQQIELVAPTDASVLILGESGTGKELVAREIHKRSKRHDGPMIKVNCASIPKELYESEFFGHVRGSFTGAVKDRIGRFEAAGGGTLFLDEVGEIPPELQSKLLRVLQEGQYERVGEEVTREVDVRVVTATNRDLKKEVERGRFRRDLYYRLNVFPIEVEPLRRRSEDVPVLAAHFVDLMAKKLNRPRCRLTQENVRQLQAYDWPGNVRELQNVIERALIVCRSRNLQFDLPDSESAEAELPDGVTRKPDTDPDIVPEVEMQRRERENITAALRRSKWKIHGPGGAAELLGIKATTLSSRIRKLGLEKPRPG